MIERTLVLIKPDGVQRALVGRILSRFEDVGLKIVGMKFVQVNKDFAGKHYFDVAQRRGEAVFQNLVQFITSGPVVAFVFEGVHAIELVRKLIGATEPRTAAPGTIRGDFSHHSYAHTDAQKKAISNLVHASGSAEDAAKEIPLWFTEKELVSYRHLTEKYTF